MTTWREHFVYSNQSVQHIISSDADGLLFVTSTRVPGTLTTDDFLTMNYERSNINREENRIDLLYFEASKHVNGAPRTSTKYPAFLRCIYISLKLVWMWSPFLKTNIPQSINHTSRLLTYKALDKTATPKTWPSKSNHEEKKRWSLHICIGF